MNENPRTRHRRALCLLLVSALHGGCGGAPSPPQSTAPAASHGALGARAHQLKRSDLSAAEQKYGLAPVPDASVTYQPDVIIVGGGADAIRGESADGLSWTIDAGAPRAADLRPGKIMFMTNRAVGRVLAVQPSGGDLVVFVGPADITDVIRDAQLRITNMPIDFGEAIAHTAPDFPGQLVPLTSNEPAPHPAAAMVNGSAAWRVVKTDLPTPAPAAPDVSDLIAKNLRAEPHVNTSGIGMRVTADGAGLEVEAESSVHLLSPSLNVVLLIENGGVQEASVELTGAAGLSWRFAAGTDVGRSANINAIVRPAADFSIEVGGIGPVPLAVTVRQSFKVATALGVKNSTISAQGDYVFTGGFKMGYFGGKWSIAGPTGFSSRQSMAKTGSGLSMAVTGLDLADQIRVVVGIGKFGFAAGPYLSFTSAVGTFRNSDIGLIACTGAILDVELGAGIGYLIPKALTDLVNGLLKTLNIDYSISDHGGISPAPNETIINKQSKVGGCKVEENSSAKGVMQGPV